MKSTKILPQLRILALVTLISTLANNCLICSLEASTAINKTTNNNLFAKFEQLILLPLFVNKASKEIDRTVDSKETLTTVKDLDMDLKNLITSTGLDTIMENFQKTKESAEKICSILKTGTDSCIKSLQKDTLEEFAALLEYRKKKIIESTYEENLYWSFRIWLLSSIKFFSSPSSPTPPLTPTEILELQKMQALANLAFVRLKKMNTFESIKKEYQAKYNK